MTDKQSELFDAVEASIFVLELDQEQVPRYVSWNRAAERQSGLLRTAVIGKTARDVYAGPEGEAEYARHLAAARSDTATVYETKSPAAGLSTWWRTTLKSLQIDMDTRQYIVGTSIDVSHEHDVRRLEKTIASFQSEAEQFVALAAHDLRAPMRNISILTEMLRENFNDAGDGKLELINLLEEVALKSDGLLREVLNHTQDVSSKPQHENFNLHHLCQSLCAVLDPQSEHIIRWPKVTISADKTAFQIVLRNLLDNAIKYGEKSPLSIDITLSQHNSAYIEVQVRDDGPGFAFAGRALADTGSLRSDKGFGLFTIRRLITARGGNIYIDDKPDEEGCSIRFTLPGTIKPLQTLRPLPAPNARKTG